MNLVLIANSLIKIAEENDDNKIVKIVSVVDTRQYEERGDKWYPIPGSGTSNECARCGKPHEVHAEVALGNGKHIVVGTGCMRTDSAELLREMKNKVGVAKKKKVLLAEIEQLKKLAEEYKIIEEKAAKVIPPWINLEKKTKTYEDGHKIHYLQLGDAILPGYTLDWKGDIKQEDKKQLEFTWRKKRERELGATFDQESARAKLKNLLDNPKAKRILAS